MIRRDNNIVFFLVFFGITLLIIILGKVISNNGTNAVWKVASVFSVSKNKNSDKDKLLQENSNLQKKLLDEQELAKENQALRDQFSTTSINPTSLIPAKVVGSPGFVPGISNPDYLVIDRGTSDGLKNGDSVVYQNNFVGKITNITSNYSRVKIALNLDSFTGKIAGDKEILGVVRGKGNVLVFDNVLLSEKLAKDQVVLTKGDMDEKGVGIPADLMVGKIISIEKKSSDLFQRAEVKSQIDFKNLSIVFVIK